MVTTPPKPATVRAGMPAAWLPPICTRIRRGLHNKQARGPSGWAFLGEMVCTLTSYRITSYGTTPQLQGITTAPELRKPKASGQRQSASSWIRKNSAAEFSQTRYESVVDSFCPLA